MTIRNLEYVFNPKSIAVIGASKSHKSVGALLAHNLFHAGFDGPVMPVNPRHRAVQGVLAYPDIASLPVTPDLAIICTRADTVPEIIAELGERGTKAAVIITAGLGESIDRHGEDLQLQMLQAAQPHLLRIIGPNSLGVMVPRIGLNASFSHVDPLPGKLAFVAQSGAIVASVLDWATTQKVGFSHLVSLGGMCDVDFGDMLDYLANDQKTKAILLYIEAVTNARKFMSAARAASRMKPVVVVKVGRHAEGARAAESHSGALAGSDAVYETVFRRAGMLRVLTLAELFHAVEILSTMRVPASDRLGILTNGGGIGVLATDALMDQGGHLAKLLPQTMQGLAEVLPPTWSHANPVDIVGDADGKRYSKAMEVLANCTGIDALLVLNCPTGVASSTEAAAAVIDQYKKHKDMSLITSWVGNGGATEARRLFAANRIPTYEAPSQAVRSFMYLVNFRRSQELLMETPPSIPESFSSEPEKVRAIIRQALDEQREWLTEPEAMQVIAAYGVPVAHTYSAPTPAQAAALAAQIGGPVALKILSPDITHKSDVGGVGLDLLGPAAVRAAAEAMMAGVHRAVPDAVITGFTVAPMVRRPGAYELIVGVNTDQQFGPVILFGHGGTAVEVLNDRALGLPPLNMHLAQEIMSRTRIFRLLEGYRELPAANLDTIALTLIRISQLAIDHPEIVELDINPLLADEYGVIALDSRIRIERTSYEPGAHLAIRPYPIELEETIQLADGRELLLRPILPEDEPTLRDSFKKYTPEEVRLRFFIPVKTLSHVTAARFTQIDYNREMALVLTVAGTPGKTEIFGVVRINADPNNEHAEYAIIIRGEMTGMGLGILLMRRIIDYAKQRGIGEIYGDILRENGTMLRLCEALGFTSAITPDDFNIVRVTLKL